jgi:hypothetical protein
VVAILASLLVVTAVATLLVLLRGSGPSARRAA